MREISDMLNNRSDDNCRLDTRDLQLEMYWEIDIDYVQFDEFEGYEKATENSKKNLCLFEHQKILFIMHFYMV